MSDDKHWIGRGMIPTEERIRIEMEKVLAEAREDVAARVRAGAKLLDPVKDTEQIERNRQALQDAVDPLIEQILDEELGEP